MALGRLVPASAISAVVLASLAACADTNTDRMLQGIAVSLCRSASNCEIYQQGGRYDPPAVYDQGRLPGETLVYDPPREDPEAPPY